MTARSIFAAAAAGLLWPAAAGMTQVVEFEDKAQWLDAVGPFQTADFTGFPSGTPITDQYADLGALFTDGQDVVLCCDGVSFPNDEAGLRGFTSVSLQFRTPLRALAFDAVSVLGAQISLFREGRLVHVSSVFGLEAEGFAGLVSPAPFDEALIGNAIGEGVGFDDLHFGVPSPGALSLLAIALVCWSARPRARGAPLR